MEKMVRGVSSWWASRLLWLCSRSATAAALLSLDEVANAQDYETVVTVSGEDTTTFEAERSVSSISIDGGHEALAGSTVEVVDELPAVQVQKTSSGSGVPILRGLTGYRILLSYDGLRLNDSLTRAGGNEHLALVDAAALKSVEIIRGPASVLYGSDALGGVLLLRPREADVTGNADLRAHGGLYARAASAEASLRAQLNGSISYGAFGGRVTGGLGTTGEVERGGERGEQPFTGYDDRHFTLRLMALPGRRHRIGASYQYAGILDVWRSDLSTPEDQRRTVAEHRDLATVWYRGALEKGVRLQARAGLMSRRALRRRFRPADDQIDDERDAVLTLLSAAQVEGRPWHAATLTGGFDLAVDWVDSDTTTIVGDSAERGRGRYVGESRYGMYGVFGLLDQRLSEHVSAEVGLRGTIIDVDAPPDPLFREPAASALRLESIRQAVVGTAGVRFEPFDGVALVANALLGFRAPNLEDFQAFGGGARAFSVPNPELGDERSWTGELGMKVRHGGLSGQLFGYASYLTGLVVRVPTTFEGESEIDGRAVQTRENASDAVIVGCDADATYQWSSGFSVGLSFQAVYGKATLENDVGLMVEEPAPKIAPPSARLSVGYETSRFWALVMAQGALPQSRLAEEDKLDVRLCPSGPDDCEVVDAWASVAVRAGLRISDEITLMAAVENLTDSPYKTFASGVWEPGINVVAALRLQR